MTLRTQARRAVAAGLLATALAAGGGAAAAPPSGEIRLAGSPNAVAGSYLVVLKAGSPDVGSRARSLSRAYGATVSHVYGVAVKGFSARMSTAAAKRLAANPAVAYVEQDQ